MMATSRRWVSSIAALKPKQSGNLKIGRIAQHDLAPTDHYRYILYPNLEVVQ